MPFARHHARHRYKNEKDMYLVQTLVVEKENSSRERKTKKWCNNKRMNRKLEVRQWEVRIEGGTETVSQDFGLKFGSDAEPLNTSDDQI